MIRIINYSSSGNINLVVVSPLEYRNQFVSGSKFGIELGAKSLDYMGKIEVNINKPGLKTIIKLANALKVEPYKLFKF